MSPLSPTASRFWVASLSLGVSMTANTANASQPASFFSSATRYQSGRKSLPSAESLQKFAFIFRHLLLFSHHPFIFSHINPSLPAEPRTSAAPAGALGCLGGKDGGKKNAERNKRSSAFFNIKGFLWTGSKQRREAESFHPLQIPQSKEGSCAELAL